MSSDRVPSDEFKEYEQKVKTLNKQPAQDDMLTLYRYYKQVTVGDAPEGQTFGMFDMKGKYKYKSWCEARGMSQEDAEKAYIELVKKLIEADEASA